MSEVEEYQPGNVIDAIARQIAEGLVASCQVTCNTPNPTIDAITTDAVLNQILGKIGNGKYVKFKNWMLQGAFLLVKNSVIIAGFRTRFDARPHLRDFIGDICANQCNVETLQGVIKFMIHEFGSSDDVKKYFEMKNPPRGGRRGRRGGRRGTAIGRRGHKTRRHKRRSTRKH